MRSRTLPSLQFSRPTALGTTASAAAQGVRPEGNNWIENTVADTLRQSSNERIAVDGLKQVLPVVAHIPDLSRRVRSYFPLDSEAPGMDPVRSKVRGHLGLAKGTRIGDAKGQEGRQFASHCRTKWRCRKRLARQDRLRQNLWRRTGNVEIDIVEGRIIA